MSKKKLYCHKCNVDVDYDSMEIGDECWEDYIPDCAKCGTKLITEREKQKIINVVNNYLNKRSSSHGFY